MYLFIQQVLTEPLLNLGYHRLEEEINMTIAVSAFMTLVQELRKQICNCISSSKGLTSVS